MRLNFLIALLAASVIVYILFGLFLFLNQKSIIYFPNGQDFENCKGFMDYKKISYEGTKFYYKKSSADNVIIIYHGNAGSACDRSNYKLEFEKLNISLIFVEYAGYSNDNKMPSKNLIFKDVDSIRSFASREGFKKIVIYGESIGTGPASYHASMGADSLILVSPFSALEDVVQSKYIIYPASILLTEKYDNAKMLKNFAGQIIILHGDKDSIIPYRFSRKLFDSIQNDNKEYILIKGAGHNDLWSSELFKDKMAQFIKKVTDK